MADHAGGAVGGVADIAALDREPFAATDVGDAGADLLRGRGLEHADAQQCGESGNAEEYDMRVCGTAV
jgi:hypothetical protein